MTPAQVSVRKAWEINDLNTDIMEANRVAAIRHTFREKRLTATLGRPIPYAECLERLLARG